MRTRTGLILALLLALFPVVVSCRFATSENQVSSLEETGSGDIKRGSLDDAATRASDVGIEAPDEDPVLSVVEEDETFATVAVDVELYEPPNSTLHETPSFSSMTAGALTPADIDEEEYRTLILEVINQVMSFRATTTDPQGTYLLVHKANGDFRTRSSYSNGLTEEHVVVGGTICRNGDWTGGTWDCSELDFPEDFVEEAWTSVVEGTPSSEMTKWGAVLIGHSASFSRSRDGQPCLRHSNTYSHPETGVVGTTEMCFSLRDYFPLELIERSQPTTGAGWERITVYTDFDIPLIIELPDTR